MTWLRFSFSNLCVSPLTSIVNVLLMALGTASIVVLILAGSQISEVMARDARGIDLVLGATGSPVQLVLASVYHADLPPGNIAFEDATRWGEDPRVSAAVPVSIGDSFDGFRIVGTSQEFLSLYDGMTDAGRLWERPLEAVVGAAVARESGLAVGSKFEGAHGLEGGGQSHADESYEVVGVLASTGSVMDRLILTSLESVWLLHSPHGGSHEHDADASHASELESDADGRSGDHSDEIDHVDDHDDHDDHDNRDHHDEHNEE
ncbi:MAG: ABC transporter permease, partial [Pseudomonadota bacterium]